MVACPERGLGTSRLGPGWTSTPSPGSSPREDHPCIQSDRGDFQMNISMVLRWYQHHERTVNFCSGPYLETGVMEALCGGTFKHRIVFSTRGSLQKCVS